MCARITRKARTSRIADWFECEEVEVELDPSFNVAPSQPLYAIHTINGKRVLDVMSWGLMPSWGNEQSPKPINARAETLSERPMFKAAFRRRRCLIPADGFYEWEQKSSVKQPMYFTLPRAEMFALAGIWEAHQSPDGSVIHSCAIITVPANELMKPIHHRMPAILRRGEEKMWMDPDFATPQSLLVPYPADEMEAWPVSTFVNRPTNDSPRCIERESMSLFD